MKHVASPKFWKNYNSLPDEVQRLANKSYSLLKQAPEHPSLHLKKVGKYWSVRVGLHYRALAVQRSGDLVWFWIGTHDDYDEIIASA